MTALLAPAALAQQTGGDQHHPAGTAAQTAPAMPMSGTVQGMPGGMMPGSGMPMMGMMQMMMDQGGMGQMGAMMAGHIEGRIAFLKTELKITAAQQSLWKAVADVMRANAASRGGMSNGMAMMGSAATLPTKLAAREKAMAAHLEQLRKLKAAVEPLYAALSDDQKKTADELMSNPMGMGMM
ncbi:MAG TPA: Spy/CpxP family protein refolding chaperone [Stellaceae bacterium]|nr:Spy/CpxP family protein refolding chaperone [Stellaceae bacterium]